ncbi:hypothetical protein Asi02nite_03600 [Asanoa siamensis]|uniref:Uncharacterized protein n=1 Tax=Asanoa siamensis TaxID=926357 RepID=A0ABQ4CHT9_9ACTN|nr:hypothetical protein Asi02nite_03600 [Asanoa siamensis]
MNGYREHRWRKHALRLPIDRSFARPVWLCRWEYKDRAAAPVVSEQPPPVRLPQEPTCPANSRYAKALANILLCSDAGAARSALPPPQPHTLATTTTHTAYVVQASW